MWLSAGCGTICEKTLQQLLSAIYNIPSTSGKVLLTILVASEVVNSFGKSVFE